MGVTLKSGNIAKTSGQYALTGPRGGYTGKERTVTKGEPLPPTPKKNMKFVLVDITQN
jgi:hypothetical protein